MAQVIDALLVTLGLDATEFVQNTLKTQEHLKHLREEAKETANQMKEQGEQAKEFFHGLIEGAVEFFGIAMGVGALVEFTHKTIEAEVSAGRLAKAMHVDVEELEALQMAAKREGGSAEGMSSSIETLATKLEKLGTKLRGAKMAALAFSQVGLSEAQVKGKSVVEVMGLLADKFEGKEFFKNKAFGQILGLDDATVRLLMRGRDGLKELTDHMKLLGVASGEEVESSHEVHNAMLDLEDVSKSVGRILVEALKPGLLWLTNVMKNFGEWAQQNPNVLKATFIGLAAGIAAAGIAAGIAYPAIFAVTWPIQAVALAVGALSAGIAYLWLQWETLKEGGEVSEKMLMFFMEMANLLGTLTGAWDAAWANMADVAVAAFERVAKIFHLIFDPIIHTLEALGRKIDAKAEEKGMHELRIAGVTIYKDRPARELEHGQKAASNTWLEFSRFAEKYGTQMTPEEIKADDARRASRHIQVHIDNVEVSTQATDAQGIAGAIKPAIEDSWSDNWTDNAEAGAW